jgi:SnoaL-like domain
MTRGTSKNRDFALRTGAAKDRLVDRLAIADAAYLYAAAVDILGNNPFIEGKEDRALVQATQTLEQCLTPDAQLRLFLTGPSGSSTPLGSGGPAEAAAAIRAYFKAYGYVGTQHNVGNIRIAFTGPDSACATCQIPCFHWLADQRMLLAPVSYADEMLRTDDVWKIAARNIYAMRFWIASGYAPDPLDPTLGRRSG